VRAINFSHRFHGDVAAHERRFAAGLRISATVPSPPAVSRSATTTFKPSAANAWAVARPIPAAAR
jgi:hypothetical protein